MEKDKELFAELEQRRTVDRLREQFEGGSRSRLQSSPTPPPLPPRNNLPDRRSLPASRFQSTASARAAAAFEQEANEDEYGQLCDCRAGPPAPQNSRRSRVAEGISIFESNCKQHNKSGSFDVPSTSRPAAAHRELQNRPRSPPDRELPAPPSDSSSPTPPGGRVFTSRTTTVLHTTVVSARSRTRTDDEDVQLRHRRPKEEVESLVYDNPAVDADGEERIVLRMKEEERQFDRRTRYQSVFKEVPLYQTYSKEVIRRESCRARQGRILDSDIFEQLNIPAIDESPVPSVSGSGDHEAGALDDDASRHNSTVFGEAGAGDEAPADGGAANHEPLTRMLAGAGPKRTMWAEMDEVLRSGVLTHMSEYQRNLEELLFEVITSEASYFRSLEILVSEFYKAPEFDPSNGQEAVLTALQKVHLFSNILRISEMSTNFLTDLEAVWQQSPTDLADVTRIIYEHAEEHFKDYVPYIRNQIYMNKAFAQLDTNERFKEVVRRIQSRAECGSIWDFRSFILLPMQRVTRLKLLLDNIMRVMVKANVSDTDKLHKQAVRARAALVKVLEDAETEQDMMTQKERLVTLTNQLEWTTGKAVSISNKTLVKEGKLRLLYAEKSFRKRSIFSSSKPLSVYLFLFNDLLIVAKVKNNNRYAVIDHCPRAALLVKLYPPSDSSMKFPFDLQLLENHCKSIELFRLDVDTETERERWMVALSPASMRDNSKESVYDEWDCPQVLVTRNYDSRQPDELNLKEGELYTVERKTPDGWYLGMGTTGKSGWFPSSHTVEVENDHVRYRLLRNMAMATTRKSSATPSSRKSSIQPSLNSYQVPNSNSSSTSPTSPTPTVATAGSSSK